eukprot:SAG31_NODE_2654_length_5292_cov_2.266898_4_plen_372_part_00
MVNASLYDLHSHVDFVSPGSVMSEMMWDPTLDPTTLITEFLDGYYRAASPFIRLYMDTMHAAVDETAHFLRACCVQPPAGIHKTFLTPLALLESASAFKEGLAALKPTEAKLIERVERASMAISYVFLWRWAELREAASNISYSWPLADEQEAAFSDFARIFNATGTQILTIGTQQNKGGAALDWLHQCVFGKCPGGSVDGQPMYAEVVLDECSSPHGSTMDCQHADMWTAAKSKLPNGTMFINGLSNKTCYALNVPPTTVAQGQVLAYGDATEECSPEAVENQFISVGSGMLSMTKGFFTAACKSTDGCCVEAVPGSGSLVMAACDPTNTLQQFEIEGSLFSSRDNPGKPGRIKDKKGRCLTTKNCARPS